MSTKCPSCHEFSDEIVHRGRHKTGISLLVHRCESCGYEWTARVPRLPSVMIELDDGTPHAPLEIGYRFYAESEALESALNSMLGSREGRERALEAKHLLGGTE
jgi:hypothetical protein